MFTSLKMNEENGCIYCSYVLLCSTELSIPNIFVLVRGPLGSSWVYFDFFVCFIFNTAQVINKFMLRLEHMKHSVTYTSVTAVLVLLIFVEV